MQTNSTSDQDQPKDASSVASGPDSQPSDQAAQTEQVETTIVDLPEHSRYQLTYGGKRAGYATYRRTPGRVVFDHTVIDPAYGGKGLGSKLVKHILDDAVSRGERIVPECSFVAAFARKHHDYDSLVDWPEGL